MAEITVFWKLASGAPLTAPADAPLITVRRIDTQAIVAGPSAMTEIGDGNFSFTFASVATLEYTATADGDPIAAGQVPAVERFKGGSFSGIEIDNINTGIPAIFARTDVATSTRASAAALAAHDAAILAAIAAIQESPFLGMVWVDGDIGSAGTTFPRGTPTDPVDNIDDAKTIADANLLRTLVLMSQGPFYTPTGSMDLFNIISPVPDIGGIAGYDGNAQSHANVKFQGLNLIGDFAGSYIRAANCSLQGITRVQGEFDNCEVLQAQVMEAQAVPILNYADCNFRDLSVAAIDFTTSTFGFIRVIGGGGAVSIRNMADANHTLIIENFNGTVTIEATCTAGTISIKGALTTVVNNGVGVTVTDTSIATFIRKKLLTVAKFLALK